MRRLRDELAEQRTSASRGGGEDEAALPNDNFAAPADPWALPALECVRFVFHDDTNNVERFPPAFAHQIFGEQESIVGYRGLQVEQHYTAGSLRSCTIITHQARRAKPPPRPASIWDALREWHPEEDESTWTSPSLDALVAEAASEEERTWAPPGERIHSYQLHGSTFEVWHSSFHDERARAYHRRMRVFAIWFIDGARFLDENDTKWDIFTLFCVRPSGGRSFCGYTTAYPFFAWDGSSFSASSSSRHELEQVAKRMRRDDDSPQEEQQQQPWYQRRFRISQVLFLPPYQRRGHGRCLLEFLYQWAASRYAPLRDITVEDPSPAFVALRDTVDLHAVSGSVDNDDAVRAILQSRHTCSEQVERILTLIHWGRAVRSNDEAQQQQIRLAVKRRLYKLHAADIPDGEGGEEEAARKLILSELWEEERTLFEATLRAVKLL